MNPIGSASIARKLFHFTAILKQNLKTVVVVVLIKILVKRRIKMDVVEFINKKNRMCDAVMCYKCCEKFWLESEIEE